MTTAPPVFDRLATLGDLTRSRILALLADHELSVTEICQVTQLPQSTVSGHLRSLASSGWVTSRADGRNRFYRMAERLPSEARSLWELVRSELSGVEGDDRRRLQEVLAVRVDRSRAFFAESADDWDRRRDELYGYQAEFGPLFGLLDPEWVVADLGTGTGRLASMLAPRVGRVVGIDRSEAMLEAARTRLAAHDNVDLRMAELESLPLDDGSIDLAIIHLVLHFVSDPEVALAQAARVLRPGGRLLLVDALSHDRVEYREAMGHVWTGFEEWRIRSWMEAAGLEQPHLTELSPDPDALGPVLFVASGHKPA